MSYANYSHSRFRSRKKARVEIIPLIDVMFLLLCFFIYATMNMVMQKGIFVDLAPADSAESLQQSVEEFILSIDREGQYFVNQNPIAKEDLLVFLDDIQKSSQEFSMVINADEEVPHGRVIGLLDLVRKKGIDQAVFAVKEPEQGF